MKPETAALIETFDGWLHPEEGDTLAGLASAVPANHHIVECGAFAGRSTSYLIAGSADGQRAAVTAIDPWAHHAIPGNPGPQLAAAVERLFYANVGLLRAHLGAACPEIHAIKGYSEDVARGWDGANVSLMFLDGSKAPGLDIAAWQHVLTPGAIVACHDYGQPHCPDVKRDITALLRRGGGWADLGLVKGLKVIGRQA